MRLEPIARAGVHLQLARRQIAYGKKEQAAHHLRQAIKAYPLASVDRLAIEVLLGLTIGRGLYSQLRRLRRSILRLRKGS